MVLDSGMLTVWRGENASPPGGMPKPSYTRIWASYYGEKTVGVTRWYTAQQHGDHPDLLVEVQRTWELRVGTDRVVLFPAAYEDRGSYKITQVQQVTDENGLPMTDLTLERDDGIDAADITGGACCAW